LKPSAEQQFLYGHHVLKSGLGRITENTPKYQGVVVLSMNDMPLVSESKTYSTVNGDMMFCILYHPYTQLSVQK
jgi:Protein involved in ribosomal biogenesis, contains PUA domain